MLKITAAIRLMAKTDKDQPSPFLIEALDKICRLYFKWEQLTKGPNEGDIIVTEVDGVPSSDSNSTEILRLVEDFAQAVKQDAAWHPRWPDSLERRRAYPPYEFRRVPWQPGWSVGARDRR